MYLLPDLLVHDGSIESIGWLQKDSGHRQKLAEKSPARKTAARAARKASPIKAKSATKSKAR